jgi:hypothetical protein
MAHVKERPGNSIEQPGQSFDDWVKRRLPWLHRFNQLAVDWLSRPHPGETRRSVLISGLLTLIIIVLVIWLTR